MAFLKLVAFRISRDDEHASPKRAKQPGSNPGPGCLLRRLVDRSQGAVERIVLQVVPAFQYPHCCVKIRHLIPSSCSLGRVV